MMPISMEEEEEDEQKLDPDIKADRLNIFLLTYMNVLQAIPRYLASASIPLILQNRKVTYTDQSASSKTLLEGRAEHDFPFQPPYDPVSQIGPVTQAGFSFVSYAFCFKLLWAPIVDSIYSEKVGRRKTWLAPTQYLIGILLFVIAMNVDEWLGSEDGARRPKMGTLTVVFFLVLFLTSVQDIALDGWSLTMLQKRNRGHAATCAMIGAMGGQLGGFVAFIVLDSKEFSNKFRSVPRDYGFVDFGDFLIFWSAVYIISTTLLFIFKKEESSDLKEDQLDVAGCYKRLWQILKIIPIQRTCFLLLTYHIAFGAINNAARLKLMDAGVPRDTFVLLTTPSLFILITLPFLLGRYIAGHRAMRIYMLIYALKITFSVAYTIFIFFTPYAKDEYGSFPTWYFWLLSLIYNIEYVRIMYRLGWWRKLPTCRLLGSLCGRILAPFVLDPRFGGIYMSLFSTVMNIGYQWPSSLCLWLVDLMTFQTCVTDEVKKIDVCSVKFDGFFAESIMCALIGVLWLLWWRKRVYKLEDMDTSAWLIKTRVDTLREKNLLTDNTPT